MAVEMLTYADLADRLKSSPEAARSIAKRDPLPTPRSNDGKALSIHLAERQHAPLPMRSPPRGRRVDTFTLKACIDSLQKELAKVEAIAAGHRADFQRERAENLG
jgi:hypothetical protein